MTQQPHSYGESSQSTDVPGSIVCEGKKWERPLCLSARKQVKTLSPHHEHCTAAGKESCAPMCRDLDGRPSRAEEKWVSLYVSLSTHTVFRPRHCQGRRDFVGWMFSSLQIWRWSGDRGVRSVPGECMLASRQLRFGSLKKKMRRKNVKTFSRLLSIFF